MTVAQLRDELKMTDTEVSVLRYIASKRGAGEQLSQNEKDEVYSIAAVEISVIQYLHGKGFIIPMKDSFGLTVRGEEVDTQFAASD